MAIQGFQGSAVAKGVHRTIWAAVINGNQGLAQSCTFPIMSVQLGGTFGAAGSVNIEGSNDGTTWYPLHDTTNANTVLTLTAAGIHDILEHPLYIRPNVTAGDGTTSLTVTLIQRTSNVGV